MLLLVVTQTLSSCAIKRPPVKESIEKGIVAGHSGMGFYAEEFSGPAATGDSLTNLAAISAINKALAKRGTTLVFVLVPIKSRIYEDRMLEPLPETVYNRYDLVKQALEKEHVLTPDINSFLLKSPTRDSDKPYYFNAGTHWTPQAGFEVGEFVAKELTDKVRLDDIPKVAFTKHNTESQISGPGQLITGAGDGDLIRLSPANDPVIAKINHTTKVTLPSLETDIGLLDAAPQPRIVQTGTSYSYHDVLATGLRYGFQRDVLLVARDAVWYLPFKEYLASQEFQAKPPRLLIWEYPERSVAMKFTDRDPEKMVADALGWCETGIKPSELVQVKATPGLSTWLLKFESLLPTESYLSVRLRSKNTNDLWVSNPSDQTQPAIAEGVAFVDTSSRQIPLNRVLRTPSKLLKFHFQAVKGQNLGESKILDARVCIKPPIGTNVVAK